MKTFSLIFLSLLLAGQVLAQTPNNLSAQAVNSTQICVRWGNTSARVSGSEIWRSTDNRNFTKVADAAANATEYCNTGLSPNTRYYYYVKALVPSTSGFQSPTVDATTTLPPPVVNTLAASTQGTTSIRLTWTDVGKEASYYLERRTGQSGNFARIATTGVNYTDNALAPGTEYCYRVQYIGNQETGGYSNIACATTQQAIPNAPARLTAQAVLSSQINLAWADVSDNETGFEVERSPDGSTNWTRVADLGINTTTFQNTGLNPNTRYFYRVRAKNGAGNSGYTNTADATTPDTPPAAPARLTATATGINSVSLTWADLSGNETGFEIERASTSNGPFVKIGDVAANVTTYTDGNLTQATQYCYRVWAKNSIGNSGFSNTSCATTPAAPPAAPARLTAVATSPTQINLQWADVSNNESGFDLERASSATATFTRIADLPANATTYSDGSLTETTQYCYRVRAKNAVGNSAYTEIVCVTTPLAPPAAPANLRAEIVDYDQIRVSWPGLPASVSTVIVERSTSPTGSFSVVSQLPASQGAYVDKNLAELTTYYYRIRAVNAAGQSGNSNVANATTPEAIIGTEDPILAEATVFIADQQLVLRFDHVPVSTITLNLLRLTGQTAFSESVRLGHTGQWTRSVESLPTGVYVVILEDRERNARAGRKVFIP